MNKNNDLIDANQNSLRKNNLPYSMSASFSVIFGAGAVLAWLNLDINVCPLTGITCSEMTKEEEKIWNNLEITAYSSKEKMKIRLSIIENLNNIIKCCKVIIFNTEYLYIPLSKKKWINKKYC